ncbi:MAG TPA: 2OG-Fe(II) oxygenase [Kofleriaceae bacterium]|nr:2OG-Fe(II) oxygenase [Kofleriaceae bacterium]
MSRSVIIVDRFAPEAPALRRTFDERFADPRSTRADRFVWDYWHVPGQYTALRTPAWTYFPPRAYAAFHRRLVAWGRETLGCHDVSPPWLSLYVEGCRQELHGDLPHGPWAFVFSLTRGRAFAGGETLLVRDEVLDYWHGFASERSIEEGQLLRAIEPRFARLVAFDPRIPHGVRAVTGTRDPRQGRLVIHGWFVQPRPFVRGPLAARALGARIAELTDQLGGWLGALPIAGLVSFAFDVDRRGAATSVRLLSDTTRVPRADEPARRALVRRIRAAVAGWRFGAQRGASRVTLPLVFTRE